MKTMRAFYRLALLSLLMSGLMASPTVLADPPVTAAPRVVATPGVMSETLKVQRQILLPDGKPAAGVKVVLRSLNKAEGTLKQEVKAVTDVTGLLSAEIEVEKEEGWGDPNRVTGYMMVDAPGAALTFENFNNWRRRSPADVEPLRLSSGYAVTGKVVTNGQVPVPNAKIVVLAFSSNWSPWRLNYPDAGINTPELTGISAADGTYTLRPVAIQAQNYGNGDVVIRLNMSASATVDGQTWIGWTELAPRKVKATLQAGAPPGVPPAHALPQEGATPQDNPDPYSTLTLYPGVSVKGKVLDQAAGQPVVGATARLIGHPNFLIVTLPPAQTDQDGRFEFKNVPAVFQLFVEVTHPDKAKGWTRIGEERLAAFNRNATQPMLYDDVSVKLRSWATVTGQLIEEETGKAPPAEHLYKPKLYAIYEEGYNDGYIGVGRAEAKVEVKPDGRFEMKMAVGSNHILLFAALHSLIERPLWIEVPPAGLKEWGLKVRRQPSFYVRFESDDPAGLEKTEIFRRDKPEGNGSQVGGAQSGYYISSTQNWGDKTQIRVTRGSYKERRDLVPWTEITADPKNWPLVIKVP